nr:rod shape-determining protein [Clostridia bacterium]
MHFFAPDIGIDLGSSNTQVYVKKRGIVISEPTLVVVSGTNKRIAQHVGDEARRMLGRTNDTRTIIRPIRNGAIADFDMTGLLLKYFMRKAIGVSHLVSPKVVVSVPAGLDDVNRKAITEAV